MLKSDIVAILSANSRLPNSLYGDMNAQINALDLGHQQDVLDLVESLRRDRGLTVVATLHDLTLAARYGDRIAVLSGGRIVETGPPSAVLTAATIAEHFGATVRIIDDPDGPVIVPTTGEPQ